LLCWCCDDVGGDFLFDVVGRDGEVSALPALVNGSGVQVLAVIDAEDIYASSAGGLEHWDGSPWNIVEGVDPVSATFSIHSPTEVWIWQQNQGISEVDRYTVFRRENGRFVPVTIDLDPGNVDGGKLVWLPIGMVARGDGEFSLIGNVRIPQRGAPENHAMSSWRFDGEQAANRQRHALSGHLLSADPL
jgi:hypothetical protein